MSPSRHQVEYVVSLAATSGYAATVQGAQARGMSAHGTGMPYQCVGFTVVLYAPGWVAVQSAQFYPWQQAQAVAYATDWLDQGMAPPPPPDTPPTPLLPAEREGERVAHDAATWDPLNGG